MRVCSCAARCPCAAYEVVQRVEVHGKVYGSDMKIGIDVQADRAAPLPPGRMPVELTKPARLGAGPPGATSSILDRSASHRTPPTHPPKQKPLDRANTTRAPISKGSPPQANQMAQSHSQQGNGQRGPPSGQAVARQPTQKQQQQATHGAATPRRRDKQKENEEVIRQLQAICSPGDPNAVYRNLQKIGQG